MSGDWNPPAVAMIITTLATGVCSVIAAWKANKTEKRTNLVAAKSDNNSDKLDEIHHLTNGNLSRTQEELDSSNKRRDFLEKLVIELTSKCPPGTLEKASKDIETKQAQIGKRRKTDVHGEGNNRKEDRL